MKIKTIPCRKCKGTGRLADQRDLGQQMMELRLRYNVSLRRVAEVMKLSPAYLSDLENGKRTWNKDLIERFTWAAEGSK